MELKIFRAYFWLTLLHENFWEKGPMLDYVFMANFDKKPVVNWKDVCHLNRFTKRSSWSADVSESEQLPNYKKIISFMYYFCCIKRPVILKKVLSLTQYVAVMQCYCTDCQFISRKIRLLIYKEYYISWKAFTFRIYGAKHIILLMPPNKSIMGKFWSW